MNSARDVCVSWFQSKNWKPLPFQEQTWSAILKQKHGLVNAATGTGKTYAVLLPIIAAHLENKDPGIKTIWICPIRALTKEIKLAAERAVEGLDSHWIVGTRTGDTPKKERDKMRVSPPEMLITTPESMHVLMAQNGFDALVGNLNYIIVDEWHELMGSKRGVQVELCISRLKGFLPKIRIWGISATIANMDEAVSVLLGNNIEETDVEIIRSDIKKEIRVNTLLPKDIFTFPWSGHIGIRMLDEAMEVLYRYKSTLIFTNTRSQCEIWYQRILEIDPSLSGKIAMHHGSIGKEIRAWVEEALYNGELKAVVCTSSLDLGVDFRPVEAIIQVGGPKGINRFIQRAGRSGHRPGIPARIYFLPTHAMELLEGSALREGINRGKLESREPYVRSFDVLIQYLMTLACGGGFHEETIFKEIKTSFSYETITREEFDWCIQFLQTGGKALTAYDEYKKAGKDRKGIIRVADKMTALRHKLGIGTIVGDQSLMIKYENGRKIGSIEEMFINKLTIGDVFWFAGRSLEIVDIKGLDVFVRNTKATKAIVPSWQGGRMPLSSQFSEMIREVIDQYKGGKIHHPEVKKLQPLLELQVKLSSIPSKEEILIEYLESSEGFHLLIYSFEGRLVHEGLGALLAWRIAQLKPISFTIAMNDYGIELLSDQPFLLSKNQLRAILSLDNLSQDLERSISQVEMARKKFREIAFISGMIFKGYPGKMKKDRYLQTSTSLLFNVFHDYDPDNLLYLQTYDEVRIFQLEEGRLQEALERIEKQEIVLKKPERATPFAIPILVDRLREILTTEKLERRIEKMKLVMD